MRSASFNDKSAAEVIQAWYKGNFSREMLESNRVERNVKSGLDGASLYKKSSRVRKKSTERLPKVGKMSAPLLKSLISLQGMVFNKENQPVVFYGEWKFSASLKGIVEIQGRLREPFTLLVNMSCRQPDYDGDHSQYSNYLALHLDHQRAWLSMKKAEWRPLIGSDPPITP